MSSPVSDIKLAVFLGNPGAQYSRTRHNAAWLCSEYLTDFSSCAWKEKFSGVWCDYGQPGRKIRLLKPQTFMNKSGESVRKAMEFFRITPDEIVVIHDELELPFGTVQYRKGGGLGGHNGLRSIKQHLGSDGFYRFRLGIGRPSRGDVASWVLAPFASEEQPLLSTLWERSATLLDRIMEKRTNAPALDRKIPLLDGMP